MEYKVQVWDNFHYGDDDESYHAGTYHSFDEAVRAARSIVLKSLRHEFKPGMTPEQLYDRYTDFGEDPSVYPEDPNTHFSAWDYAKSMCKEICEEQMSQTSDGSG
jgi:hypothetical protein